MATQWALNARDVPNHYIAWSDYPQRLNLSFSVGDGRAGKLEIMEDGRQLPSHFRTVWNHRTCSPVPHSTIDPADHPAIQMSADRALRAAAAHLEQDAFSVNPTRSKWYFDNKPVQLDAAVKAGFTVPNTLISNNPSDVREFIKLEGECITKPLKFLTWVSDTKHVDMFATPIRTLDDVDDDQIAACPMIYQALVRKRSEYRVVVFGRTIQCFEILSQATPESAVDWRMCSYKGLQMRPAQLPEPLERRILALMSICGFVYGSLDFAVDESGEIVFFEINETGQFLWIEELVPEVPLLDMFTDFLIAADPDHVYSPKPDPLRFCDWSRDSEQYAREDWGRRVRTKLDKRFPDRVASAA
jgi:hypothetical protein